MTAQPLTDQGLDLILREARTFSHWQETPVDEKVLKTLYELTKFGPTSANCQPLRIVFVKSPEAKVRLRPALMEGNVDKTLSAPVTAILAYDTKFYEHLPRLYPQVDAKSWFVGNEAYAERTALINSSLQSGYFILAARALGLDCGPMAGFDAAAVDAAFLEGTGYTSVLLCNLGYGDRSRLHPRNPRLMFDEAVAIV